MSEDDLGPGPRTRVRRLPKKASYDRDLIYALLDQARFCHVAALVDGRAVALPTLHAREGDVLYLHGSPSSALLRAIATAGEAYLTVTHYDGLRLARSGFESSIAYRSVVVIGSAREVLEEVEKRRVLNLFVDRVLPGLAEEVRPISDAEVRLTKVVAISIDEASAKVSAGPTEDPDEDLELPIWSGTVPARLVFDEPIADARGAMARGEWSVPASVRRLLDGQ